MTDFAQTDSSTANDVSDELKVKHCLIINLDSRQDLWDKLSEPRRLMNEAGITVERLPGINYSTTANLLQKLYNEGIITLESSGWRKNLKHMRNELGCFTAHRNALMKVVENDLPCCLIIEDGVEFLRTDFENLNIKNWLDVSIIHPHMKNEGYGAQGYVVTKQGAANILSKVYPLKMPYDLALRHEMKAYNLTYEFAEPYFLKRNNHRQSSIGISGTPDNKDLNYKKGELIMPLQTYKPLYTRLLEGIMKDKSIDLDNYLTSE